MTPARFTRVRLQPFVIVALAMLAMSTPAAEAAVPLEHHVASSQARVDLGAINVPGEGGLQPDRGLRVRMFVSIARASIHQETRHVFVNFSEEFSLSSNSRCTYGREPDTRHRQRRIAICPGGLDHVQVEGTRFADEVCVIDPEKLTFDTFVDAHGGDGDDALAGGHGDDELNGDAGNDVIMGREGLEEISGYLFARDDVGNPLPPLLRDDDYLYGGPGDDGIWGGPGKDVIVGGPGPDRDLCGSGAAGFEETEPDYVEGCADPWNRDQGGNSIFSSEPRGVDPETGIPQPGSTEIDRVDCGGSASPASNFVQYDPAIDTLANCPTKSSPEISPNQIAERPTLPMDLGQRTRCPHRH